MPVPRGLSSGWPGLQQGKGSQRPQPVVRGPIVAGLNSRYEAGVLNRGGSAVPWATSLGALSQTAASITGSKARLIEIIP
jgi:hypothetical protein